MSQDDNRYSALVNALTKLSDVANVPQSSTGIFGAGGFENALSRALGKQPSYNRLSDLLKPLPPPPPRTGMDLFSLSQMLAATPKRKAFVSYHHGNDKWAYDYFSRVFGEG